MKKLICLLVCLFSLQIFAGTTPNSVALWGSIPPNMANPGDQIYFLANSVGGEDIEYQFYVVTYPSGDQTLLKDWSSESFLITNIPLEFDAAVFVIAARGRGEISTVYSSQEYGFVKDITLSTNIAFGGDTLEISHASFHVGQSFTVTLSNTNGFSQSINSTSSIEGQISFIVPEYNGKVSVAVTEVVTRDRKTLTIRPGNIAPIANFTMNPSYGIVPISIQFDGTASNDPDGSIVSSVWDFGDGTTANGLLANHTYTIAGNYFVTLTLTDNFGKVSTLTQATILSEYIEGNEDFSDGSLNLSNDLNNQFYPQNTELNFIFTNGSLDTGFSGNVVKLNGKILETVELEFTESTLKIKNLLLQNGKNEIIVSTQDEQGKTVTDTFLIWSGNKNLNLTLLDENNLPVSDAEVTVQAINDLDVKKVVSNFNSSNTITNLPNSNLVISVKKGTLFASQNLESVPSSMTLKLNGFKPASNISNDDFSQGADGWDLTESSASVSSNNLEFNLENTTHQKITRTFSVGAGSNFYEIKYKFDVTNGDSFQIVLRNATRNVVAVDAGNTWESLPVWHTLHIVAKPGDLLQIEITLDKSAKKRNLNFAASSGVVDEVKSLEYAITKIKFLSHTALGTFPNASKAAIAGISIGPRAPYAGNTKLYGNITLSGPAATTLKELKVIAKQGAKESVGTISDSAKDILINNSFGVDEFISTPNMLLFEFKDGNIETFDLNTNVELNIVPTSITEKSYPHSYSTLPPFFQYVPQVQVSYVLRFTGRDTEVGGDDWITPYAIPYLDSLINQFRVSPYHLRFGDISKMNGGRWDDPGGHDGHMEGADFDLFIDGYSPDPDNKSIASKMVSLLNSYQYLNRIRIVYVTHSLTGDFKKYINFSCLTDNRPASLLIQNFADHDTHFHFGYQEDPIITPPINNVIFSAPNTPNRVLELTYTAPREGGVEVDWGDPMNGESTGEEQVGLNTYKQTHTYVTNSPIGNPYRVRAIYLDEDKSACAGFNEPRIINSQPPVANFIKTLTNADILLTSTATDPNSSGKKEGYDDIKEYKWEIKKESGTPFILSGKAISFHFPEAGNWTIKHTVTDYDNQFDSKEETLVLSLPLKACMTPFPSYEPDQDGPITLDFDASCSTGNIRDFHWEIRSLTGNLLENFVETFPHHGNYTMSRYGFLYVYLFVTEKDSFKHNALPFKLIARGVMTYNTGKSLSGQQLGYHSFGLSTTASDSNDWNGSQSINGSGYYFVQAPGGTVTARAHLVGTNFSRSITNCPGLSLGQRYQVAADPTWSSLNGTRYPMILTESGQKVCDKCSSGTLPPDDSRCSGTNKTYELYDYLNF